MLWSILRNLQEIWLLKSLRQTKWHQAAVIRKFEVIGEAVKHIPNKVKEEHKGIQWKSMAGMRDRLIHAYFGIDYKLVWAAIKNEIPKLKPKLKKLLSSLEQEEKDE